MEERQLSDQLCACGCGLYTYITHYSNGAVRKGEALTYRHGHSGPPPPIYKPRFTGEGPNPSGFCMCQCGGRTELAKQTRSDRGEIMGKPKKFLRGHRLPGYTCTPETWEADARTGCWNWTGGTFSTGRPRWGHWLAYKRIYERDVGPVTKGLHLHHACENPMCVNPEHLEPLTPAEHAARHKKAA